MSRAGALLRVSARRRPGHEVAQLCQGVKRPHMCTAGGRCRRGRVRGLLLVHPPAAPRKSVSCLLSRQPRLLNTEPRRIRGSPEKGSNENKASPKLTDCIHVLPEGGSHGRARVRIPPRPNSLSTGKEAPEIRRGTHKRVRGHCPRKHRIAPPGPGRIRWAAPWTRPALPSVEAVELPPGGPPPDQPPRSFLHEEAVVLFLLQDI